MNLIKNARPVLATTIFCIVCAFEPSHRAFASNNQPVVNPAQQQCDRLSTMTFGKVNPEAAESNPFWADSDVRQTYLAAIHKGTRGTRSVEILHATTVGERSAVVLAAIVMHNLSLMRKNYGINVNNYFVSNLQSNTLYWSATCNFADGVIFLLHKGVDPNSESDVNDGAFNVSLLYKHSKIPKLLLAAGYNISNNYKWCKSSKYILVRSGSRIDNDVAKAIEHATCSRGHG